MTVLRPRHAESVVKDALLDARVVVINGPRQAGKTTLSRVVQASTPGQSVTLDSQPALDACKEDPAGFLEAYGKPLFIDEFQRAGEGLVRAIKVEVDRHPARGQYVLSGSSRFLTTATISESLAGRVRIVDLWPYTQGEADQLGPESDTLLYRLFDGSLSVIPNLSGAALGRADYLERICRGGYPEVHDLRPQARRQWFESYLCTVTQRDAPETGRGRHIGDLAKLARILAARTGQELIAEHVAHDAGIERSALARNYLPLLETVYLSVTLPAWSRNFTSRAVKHPKAYVADPGLAAHLLGVNGAALAAPGAPALGPLVETLVVTELIRQAARLLDPDVRLHHFRTRDQSEIDVIAEAADGRVVAIEVKAGRTVSRNTTRTLANLRDRIDDRGGRFVRGVVLYLGDDALPAGDRLSILPLAHLWRPPGS